MDVLKGDFCGTCTMYFCRTNTCVIVSMCNMYTFMQ